MKFKKVLTGSALSLALLMSAAPAFAASPTASASWKIAQSQRKQMPALMPSNSFKALTATSLLLSF
ncbi:hypothetical protein RBIBE_02840 [Bacillus velezensis]|nr:hypothetical protein RBIBE_02840 [Bacillus velezensis]